MAGIKVMTFPWQSVRDREILHFMQEKNKPADEMYHKTWRYAVSGCDILYVVQKHGSCVMHQRGTLRTYRM